MWRETTTKDEDWYRVDELSEEDNGLCGLNNNTKQQVDFEASLSK